MILDEIIFCLQYKLARWKDISDLIEFRAKTVELVLTGRGADDVLIDKADLVTKMCQVKHPFSRGIPARKGIEY